MLLQFILSTAAGFFICIAIYGAFIYYGGEKMEGFPNTESYKLGAIAVLSIVVMIITGGLLDRVAADEDAADRMNKENRLTGADTEADR